MKTILSLLVVCFSFVASASHHFGGFIVAKQLSGRQYQVTTVLLTDPNSPANAHSESISLEFGDGKTATVNRTSVSTEDGVQRSTYITDHQYASDGVFTISFTNPNLPANIVNLNGGFSETTPFNTTCLIRVGSALYTPQSANPLAFEFVKGCINKTFHFNPTFVAGDNDLHLSCELVAESKHLPNYVLPSGASINKYNGMVTFTSQHPGLYLFVFRITSFYQNGSVVAQSEMPLLFQIADGMGDSLLVDVPHTTLSSQGWYSRELTPNQTVDQQLIFTRVMPAAFSGDVYTELTGKGAAVTSVKPTANSLAFNVNWTADPNETRNTPYFITYRYRNSSRTFTDDYTVALYHGAPLNTGMCKEPLRAGGITVYPNPVSGGQCSLMFGEQHHGELLVYDILGKKVLTQAVSGEPVTIETTRWATGAYLYSFTSQTGEVLRGKIQVQ